MSCLPSRRVSQEAQTCQPLHGSLAADAMGTATLGKVVQIFGLAVRKCVVAPRDVLLSARMALWVVLVSILARITSLPRTQQLTSARLRPVSLGRPDTPARLARMVDAILCLDLFVFRRCCWKRALVLHRFLAMNGIDSRINFGVQRGEDGGMKGHAWLERDGEPFLEDHAGGYTVTFSLPRSSSASGAAIESWWR